MAASRVANIRADLNCKGLMGNCFHYFRAYAVETRVNARARAKVSFRRVTGSIGLSRADWHEQAESVFRSFVRVDCNGAGSVFETQGDFLRAQCLRESFKQRNV